MDDSFKTLIFGSSSFFRQRLPLTAWRFKNFGESIYLLDKKGIYFACTRSTPIFIGRANLTPKVKLAFYILGASITEKASAIVNALQDAVSNGLPGWKNPIKDVLRRFFCGNRVAVDPKRLIDTAWSDFGIGIPRLWVLHKKFSISLREKVLSAGKLWEFDNQVWKILNPVVWTFTTFISLLLSEGPTPYRTAI